MEKHWFTKYCFNDEYGLKLPNFSVDPLNSEIFYVNEKQERTWNKFYLKKNIYRYHGYIGTLCDVFNWKRWYLLFSSQKFY